MKNFQRNTWSCHDGSEYESIAINLPASRHGPSGDGARIDRHGASLRVVHWDVSGKDEATQVGYRYIGQQFERRNGHSIGEFFAHIDHDWPTEQIADMLVLDVDSKTHEFQSAVAGRIGPILKYGNTARLLTTPNFGMLGTRLDLRPSVANGGSERWTIPSGGFLMSVSDGVTDGRKSNGHRLGIDGVLEIARVAPNHEEAIDEVFRTITKFPDDASIVVLARTHG